MKVLRTFQSIVADQQNSFEQKINRLLTFGLEVFGLDIAIVSRIEGNDYHVRYVVCPNNEINVGDQFPLSQTYCEKTIQVNDAIAFNHASSGEMAIHPCYQNFAMESYIAAPIRVNKQVYGTVNFSSLKVSRPFAERDLEYVTLLAQWMGSEIVRGRSVQQLRNSNRMLLRLEQVGKIGSWEVDITSRRLYWSDEMKRIHEVGLDYQPTMESALMFYKEGESRDTIQRCVTAAINTGQDWAHEVEMQTAKGSVIWIATHGSAEFQNGKCVRLFGTSQDITETVMMRKDLERQREDAERALAERSHLLAKISHELRTPLNGINGMLMALLDENDQIRRREKLDMALRSSDILRNLINEVLDYSKITHGELKLEPSHFVLKTVFVDMLSIYEPMCEQKGIKLEHALQIDNDLWVQNDATRLSQIVSNLLSNAIKFTAAGAVKLTASAKLVGDKVRLIIQVNDSGIGMSQATQKTLFKPFVQGVKGIAAKYGGTGLGLSIVKELVDAMQGEIHVDSKLNEGSKFTVVMAMPEGSEIKSASAMINEPLPVCSELEVLVVDDNEINRLVMESLLQKFQVKAKTAVDGLDAIRKCTEQSFDLIFMDCVMPEMDGLAATAKIKQKGLLKPHTIVAALTANTSEADRAACQQAGMHMFIAKPVSMITLQTAIAEVCRRMELTE